MSERSSEVRSEADLLLSFGDVGEAEIAEKSVKPDNLPLPRGLRIEMERSGETVKVHIECERTLASLLTTIDDLLAMMLLALRVSREI